jgi:hypothetical protein
MQPNQTQLRGNNLSCLEADKENKPLHIDKTKVKREVDDFSFANHGNK